MSSVWAMRPGEGRPRGCVIVQPSPHWGQLPREGFETDLKVTTCALKWKSKVERARQRDEGWRGDKTRGRGAPRVFCLLCPHLPRRGLLAFLTHPVTRSATPVPIGRTCWSQELDLRKTSGSPVIPGWRQHTEGCTRGRVKGKEWKPSLLSVWSQKGGLSTPGSRLDIFGSLPRMAKAESTFERDPKVDQY